ncbi:MAG: hypothetical protein ACREHD_03920, partial [Pirellulales bacterium]
MELDGVGRSAIRPAEPCRIPCEVAGTAKRRTTRLAATSIAFPVDLGHHLPMNRRLFMRYAFVSGAFLLLISMAVAAAMVPSPLAVAQQPANRFVPVPLEAVPVVGRNPTPVPPGGANAYVIRQIAATDEGSQEMAQLRAQDAQLSNEAESLAKQLADATDDKQKAEIKEKLQDALSRQFDAQQKARELEVASIESKVKKLRDTISKRNEARRTILDKRFDQLLSEAEGLGWNSPASGGLRWRHCEHCTAADRLLAKHGVIANKKTIACRDCRWRRTCGIDLCSASG